MAKKVKSMRMLSKLLGKHGCEVSLTRNCHIKIKTPTGAVFAPLTPSDAKSHQHISRKLKAHGIDVDLSGVY